MYVVVVHNISDPEKFWSTAQSALESGGIPETITVHASFPDPSGTKAVCLWEASSVEPVRDFIEEAVGAVSDNEYFEVAAQNAVDMGDWRSSYFRHRCSPSPPPATPGIKHFRTFDRQVDSARSGNATVWPWSTGGHMDGHPTRRTFLAAAGAVALGAACSSTRSAETDRTGAVKTTPDGNFKEFQLRGTRSRLRGSALPMSAEGKGRPSSCSTVGSASIADSGAGSSLSSPMSSPWWPGTCRATAGLRTHPRTSGCPITQIASPASSTGSAWGDLTCSACLSAEGSHWSSTAGIPRSPSARTGRGLCGMGWLPTARGR